jgi:hypothetical protein
MLVAVRRERQTEGAIDDTLAASFPASDPPAWNPGFARLGPKETTRDASEVLEVSRTDRPRRTVAATLTSLAGAAGIVLLVPVAILLVGLPVALAARGLLELFLWLFPGMG